MTMQKRLITMLTIAGLLSAPGWALAANSGAAAACGKAAPAAPTRLAPLKEVTLTGNLSSQQMQIAGKTRVVFALAAATGEKIHLPSAACAARGATPAIRLADYAGQKVKIVALVREQPKGGRTAMKIRAIKSVEKVALSA